MLRSLASQRKARFAILAAVAVAASASVANAAWIGATTGTTNDAAHSYLTDANWDSADRLSFSPGLTGTANTFYFGQNWSTTGTWNITPTGNQSLTLQGGGIVDNAGGAVAAGNRTITLGGDVNVSVGGGNQNVILGSTAANSALSLDLGGVQRTFTVATGDSLILRNSLLNAGSGFILNGGGLLRLDATSNASLAGTIRLDAGELDVTTGPANALGTATVELNGGRFHLRNNSGDVNYGNAFNVTASSTFEYDSTAGGNTNPRRFIFGNLTTGAFTTTFDNNNGGWIHFNNVTINSGTAIFNSNAAEGQGRILFNGIVTDNGNGFNKTGSGELVLLNSANAITGAVNVTRGQLLLGATGAMGTPSSITLGTGTNNGFIGFIANDQTFSNNVSLSNTGSGFTAPDVLTSTNFTTPNTAVGTITGSITQSGNILILAGGNFGGAIRLNNGDRSAQVGGTRVTGTAGVSNMNNLSNGNLDINAGGTFVLDPAGPTWAQFVADRSGGYGTGSDQWQLNGGNFGVLSGTQTVDWSSIAGAPANYFGQNRTIGTAARKSDGTAYLKGTTIYATDISLPGGSDVTWTLLGGVRSMTNSYQAFTLDGPINEFAGIISGGGVGRTLTLANTNTLNGDNTGGILRLSNTNNSFVATVQLGTGDLSKGQILIATDDAVLGSSTNIVRIGNSNPAGSRVGGGLLLFEDVGGSGKTFDRTLQVHTTRGVNVASGFGAYSGLVQYTGTLTLTTINNSSAHYPGMAVHAEGNSVLELGIAGGSPNAATIAKGAGSASEFMYLQKSGTGTVSLVNMEYLSSAAADNSGNVRWALNDGALRETGTTNSSSAGGVRVEFSGGVLEFAAAPRTLTLGTGAGNLNFAATFGASANPIGSTARGGGFAASGANRTITLTNAATLVWNGGAGTSANFVRSGAPLIFGSLTANATAIFTNNIDLNANSRTIATVRGVGTVPEGQINGNIVGTGASNLIVGQHVTSDGKLLTPGTLVLAGSNNTYAGTTTVNAGTLLVNGTLSTSASVVTVNMGATLGGNGTINRPVVINSGATHSPGTSPGSQTVASETWESGGNYLFEIHNATGVAGTGWDLINVTNALTVNATSGSKFNINVQSMSTTTTNGNAINFSSGGTYNWLILDAGSALASDIVSRLNLNLANFTNTYTGTFALKRGELVGGGDDTQLYLTYSGSGTPNFIFQNTSAVTIATLKGASTTSGATSKTIENNGTAPGDATITNGVTNLTAAPGSFTNVGVGGTGVVNLNVTSTAGYGTTTGNVTVTPNTGGNNVVAVTVNVGNATVGAGNTFGAALTGTSTGADLSSITSNTEATAIGIDNGNSLSMDWRSPTALESQIVQGDIVRINTVDSDIYVLKLTYSSDLNENQLFLGELVGGLWGSAGNELLFAKQFDFLYDQGALGLSDDLGRWGIVTTGTGGYVWAVVQGDGTFAAIPEPTSLALLGLGAAGLLLRRRK